MQSNILVRLGVSLAAIAFTAISTAAEPVVGDVFEEQLAAGEFALALHAAQQIGVSEQRDAALVKLARAQAEAGAAEAAFSTLARVGDDRTRNTAAQATRQTEPRPGAGGGAQADFTSLIDLITSTVKPQTWDDVGGQGSIQEFRNGVYVDAQGVLARVLQPQRAQGLAVARLAAIKADENLDFRRTATIRKVSLPRLEKHVQLRLAAGRPLDDDMLNLAGLEKIKYVLVYPESGDLVIAGPAGAWRRDDEGRTVSQATGRAVLQLDDLVVLLRFLKASPGANFGCSIDPTSEGLARTKAFLDQSQNSPLQPGQRAAWLKKLRAQMGRQSIAVAGIDPRTRVARVIVEADYRMKLVGMGLEEGTPDVPSYLQLVRVPRGQAPPALDVLRWWFTLRYDAVLASEARDAFEIRGPGAQVLSENELLGERGGLVHTGKSEELNQEFAARFTQHFAALAEKYPVYADLQNIFDLALVSALIASGRLDEQVRWHTTCFRDDEQYRVALGQAPQSVDTVINHRVINDRHIVAGVSGGVHADPWRFAQPASLAVDSYGKLKAERANSKADEALPLEAWWWD